MLSVLVMFGLTAPSAVTATHRGHYTTNGAARQILAEQYAPQRENTDNYTSRLDAPGL